MKLYYFFTARLEAQSTRSCFTLLPNPPHSTRGFGHLTKVIPWVKGHMTQ